MLADAQTTSNGVRSVEFPTLTGGIRPSGRKVCPATGFARKGVTRLDTDAKRALDRAETAFKKKEQQLREGQQAIAEYQAKMEAIREKTARLRALRLARDAQRGPRPVRRVRRRAANRALASVTILARDAAEQASTHAGHLQRRRLPKAGEKYQARI